MALPTISREAPARTAITSTVATTASAPIPATRSAGVLVLAIVLAAIPVLAWWFPSLAGESQTELRPATVAPALPRTLGDLRRWPAKFDAYLNDHVPGRSGLIQGWSEIASAVHVSSSPEVIVGTNDWLFLRRDQAIVDRGRGFIRSSPPQLQHGGAATRGLDAEIEATGAVPWFVIVPNKSTVYPEHMPAWARPSSESATESIVRTLHDAGVPHVLDLRPVLRAAKAQGDLYWHTDTHWNARGTIVAYQAIMDTLVAHGLPRSRPALSTVDELRQGDLTRLLGRGAGKRETVPLLQVRDPRANALPGYAMRYEDFVRRGYRSASPSSKSGKLLVFGDSFTEHDLWAALQESFSATVMHHHNGLRLSRRVLRDEKPAVVMIVIAERLLPLDGPTLVD